MACELQNEPEAVDPPLEDRDDSVLIVLTREGCDDAYAALYARYHYGAVRLARHLGQREESEDVVAEAFAQVLDLVRRGKGPDHSFRSYLFTTIRHESGRRAKARTRVRPTEDQAMIDSSVPFGAGRLDDFEAGVVRAAYESLPGRWRAVLWHLDVEGRKPHELSEILDLAPNSVSALVYRARSGLRDAYLQQHVRTDASVGGIHQEVLSRLGPVVRRSASTRDQVKVHAHLATCGSCMAVYVELEDVGRSVA